MNNYKPILPEINKQYKYFDDGKIKPSRMYNVLIKEIIEETLKNGAEQSKKKFIKIDSCDDHTPFMGVCGNCGSYSMPKITITEIDKDSILNTFEQSYKKFKI